MKIRELEGACTELVATGARLGLSLRLELTTAVPVVGATDLVAVCGEYEVCGMGQLISAAGAPIGDIYAWDDGEVTALYDPAAVLEWLTTSGLIAHIERQEAVASLVKKAEEAQQVATALSMAARLASEEI